MCPLLRVFRLICLKQSVQGNTVEITVETVLSLSDDVIEALNSTIDIVIVLEVQIYESRFGPDPRVVDTDVAFTISRRSSSRGYSVKSSDGAVDQHYYSLDGALREVGRKRTFTIVLRGENAADADINYYGRARIFLDRSRLSPILKTTVYIKKSWDLNSGWTDFEL